MELPRDGQEYARISFTDLPFNVTVEVSVDERATWTPATGGTDANERKILLTGPDVNPPDGLVVEHGTRLWVRVIDSPETVVRMAGQIFLS